MNSCLSPRNGRGFQACADLEMQMLRLFFEMDAVGVAAGVAVLRAASQGESVSRPRRALLFLVADGGEGQELATPLFYLARALNVPTLVAAKREMIRQNQGLGERLALDRQLQQRAGPQHLAHID